MPGIPWGPEGNDDMGCKWVGGEEEEEEVGEDDEVVAMSTSDEGIGL